MSRNRKLFVTTVLICGFLSPPAFAHCWTEGRAPFTYKMCDYHPPSSASDVAAHVEKAWNTLVHVVERFIPLNVATAYIAYLDGQAQGKLKKLPSRFIDAVSSHFRHINFSRVRYATNIETLHGMHITIGNTIFFARSINFNSKDDVKLMLHELAHVEQYVLAGGINNFIRLYFADTIVATVGTALVGLMELAYRGETSVVGVVDIHDNLALEGNAESRAGSYIDDVWSQRPFLVMSSSSGGSSGSSSGGSRGPDRPCPTCHAF